MSFRDTLALRHKQIEQYAKRNNLSLVEKIMLEMRATDELFMNSSSWTTPTESQPQQPSQKIPQYKVSHPNRVKHVEQSLYSPLPQSPAPAYSNYESRYAPTSPQYKPVVNNSYGDIERTKLYSPSSPAAFSPSSPQYSPTSPIYSGQYGTVKYSPSSPQMSPFYSPSSPNIQTPYSPTSPSYSPVTYSPFSPAYHPMSPYYNPPQGSHL
jgi:DNA-directed RNA polymerase II subunit RPB1